MGLIRFTRPPQAAVAAGATVALLVVGLAGYYLVRYRSNADYVVRRNFRVLAVAGRQLQTVVADVISLMEAHAREVQNAKSSQGTGEDRERELDYQAPPPLSWTSTVELQ